MQKSISLEELERSLVAEEVQPDKREGKEEAGKSTEKTTTKIAPPPPGLRAGQIPRVTSPPLELTNIAGPVIEAAHQDPLAFVMTERERRLIGRVHFSQIKSEHPEIEDYYYIHFQKGVDKDSKEGESSNEDELKHLLFPMPTKKQRPQSKDREKDKDKDITHLEFGKMSKSTAARPRQQLNLPPFRSPATPSGSITYSMMSTLLEIEDLYAASLGDKPLQQVLENVRDNLPSLLALPKGQRAFKAALSSSPSSEKVDKLQLLEAFVDGFELLPASRPKVGRLTDVDFVVSNVFTVLAPLISDLSPSDLKCLTLRWLRKKSFHWLIYGRLGVIFTCMLLSRVELVKETLSQVKDAEHEFDLGDYQEVVRDTFTSSSVSDVNVNDIFEFAAPTGTSDFYIWQLLALVAINLDRAGKRALVAELRERIMTIVNEPKSGNEERLATLNLFLNAIGLDASQLKA